MPKLLALLMILLAAQVEAHPHGGIGGSAAATKWAMDANNTELTTTYTSGVSSGCNRIRHIATYRMTGIRMAVPLWVIPNDSTEADTLIDTAFNFHGALEPSMAQSRTGLAPRTQFTWNSAASYSYVPATPPAITTTAAGSYSGGQITFTTTAAHGIKVGQAFAMLGLLPSGYDGIFVAAAGTSGTTLVATASDPGGVATQQGEIVQAYALSDPLTVTIAAGTTYALWFDYTNAAGVGSGHLPIGQAYGVNGATNYEANMESNSTDYYAANCAASATSVLTLTAGGQGWTPFPVVQIPAAAIVVALCCGTDSLNYGVDDGQNGVNNSTGDSSGNIGWGTRVISEQWGHGYCNLAKGGDGYHFQVDPTKTVYRTEFLQLCNPSRLLFAGGTNDMNLSLGTQATPGTFLYDQHQTVLYYQNLLPGLPIVGATVPPGSCDTIDTTPPFGTTANQFPLTNVTSGTCPAPSGTSRANTASTFYQWNNTWLRGASFGSTGYSGFIEVEWAAEPVGMQNSSIWTTACTLTQCTYEGIHGTGSGYNFLGSTIPNYSSDPF